MLKLGSFGDANFFSPIVADNAARFEDPFRIPRSYVEVDIVRVTVSVCQIMKLVSFPSSIPHPLLPNESLM